MAKPVWPEGCEREWNCQVGFTAEFEGKDAKDAVLRFTGATMCRVFLNGEFLGYGPARAAHGFARVEELPLGGKLKPGRNVIAIEVAGYNCDSFYTVRQPSFLQAEIVADGKVIAATDAKDSAFKAGVLEERVKKVQRFSFQRTFSEAYEVWPHGNEWRLGIRPPFVKSCTLAEQPQLPLLPPLPFFARLSVHLPLPSREEAGLDCQPMARKPRACAVFALSSHVFAPCRRCSAFQAHFALAP